MGPMHGSSAEGERNGAGSEGTVSERHNDADIEFAQDMIPHHEQALLMIKMVERHGASPELESLVTTMAMTQSSEIGYMQQMLDVWGAEQPNGAHWAHGMTGMMSDEDFDRLDSARPHDFESMWATMMIEHHEGAIEMSETEVEKGANPEAVKLARDIIDAQTQEIKQLEDIAES